MEKILYTRSISFISEKASMSKLEPILCELKQMINIPDERFYNLLISVTEAFNNAIVHGNKLDSEKYVNVDIHTTSNDLFISIKDEGAGFNPDTLPDPREPENLTKDNGRGVFIIKALIDEVTYDFSQGGTLILMRFNIKVPEKILVD